MSGNSIPKGLPYLDNIETTQTSDFIRNPLIHKASEDFSVLKKYDNDDNSSAIIDVENSKILTLKLARSILDSNSYLVDKAEKMLDCGNFIEISDGTLTYANFCRLRICPMCQRRRSLRAYSDFLKMNEYLTSTYGYHFLHLVLTVPNCCADEIGATISKLYTSFSLFIHHPLIKYKFRGVARCLEVSYNGKYKIDATDGDIEGKCFHPHLHCLVAVSRSYGSGKNYLKQDLIRSIWSEVNGSDALQVYVTRIKDGDTSAVAEVAKYCFKPLDFKCSDSERIRVLEALYIALHGRRLVTFFGDFKEAKKKVKANFDDDTADEFAEVREVVDGARFLRYNFNCSTMRYETSS